MNQAKNQSATSYANQWQPHAKQNPMMPAEAAAVAKTAALTAARAAKALAY